MNLLLDLPGGRVLREIWNSLGGRQEGEGSRQQGEAPSHSGCVLGWEQRGAWRKERGPQGGGF